MILRAQLLDFYGVPVQGSNVELIYTGSQGAPTVEAILNLCYFDINGNGEYDDGEEICEHVPFNQKLRKSGAKLFINPRLINANITEHSEPASFWKIMRRKIKEKLAKVFFIRYN